MQDIFLNSGKFFDLICSLPNSAISVENLIIFSDNLVIFLLSVVCLVK